MTQQKQNPKNDWGFYISTPRIVRTHYKNITLVEKWLYVCLKDLCGATGTCYRTLRVLSEETDLSIGTLSTGIRHLHGAGLIHAEKKRRNNNPTAKEVWHITIVDIWQENAKVHPTAHSSADEQKRSLNEHSEENVQEMNNNVQDKNKDASKRSFPEQQCSNFDDRSNTNKAIPITEERTPEEDTREREHATPTGASPIVDASRSDFMACAFCFEPMATRCAHCGKRVCEVHGTGIPDDIWCPACLFLAQQTDKPPVVVDAPAQPSSYSDLATESSTMTTSNTLTDEDNCETVSQQKGQGQSQHDHNGNSGIHRRGNNRPDSGARDSGPAPTQQGLAKGHADDRPVDSIQPDIPGLPGTLASAQDQVSLPAEAHPIETPPRLAVESGRSATAPETPAPQPAHAGHSADSAVVDARSLPATAPYLSRQESTSKDKPETEPDMSGKWSNDKCVEYAEWCNERRYTAKMREEQIKAACAIHKNDTALTLEQFKAAYDERNDAWWQEHKGKLHVNDMKAKGSSGIDRVHEMLQRIEDKASKKRTASHLQLVPPPTNTTTNNPNSLRALAARQAEARRLATQGAMV